VTSRECQTPSCVKSVRLPSTEGPGGIAFEDDPGPSVRRAGGRVVRMSERPPGGGENACESAGACTRRSRVGGYRLTFRNQRVYARWSAGRSLRPRSRSRDPATATGAGLPLGEPTERRRGSEAARKKSERRRPARRSPPGASRFGPGEKRDETAARRFSAAAQGGVDLDQAGSPDLRWGRPLFHP